MNGKNVITSTVVVDKNLPKVDVGEVNEFHKIENK